MTNLDSWEADNDLEARQALWNGICVAAEQVCHGYAIKIIAGIDGEPILPTSKVPEVKAAKTWQLIEALSLLCIILRASSAEADAIGVFGKTGPVRLLEHGVERFLWAQEKLRGDSGLDGRPDLILTSSAERPHPGNAERIIEAKCVRYLDAPTIRGEFGKGHDLRVTSYFVWSFYTPSPKLVEGARGLGIELEAIGFDGVHRAVLLRNPGALISHVANSLEQARLALRFATALEAAGAEAHHKVSSSAHQESHE